MNAGNWITLATLALSALALLATFFAPDRSKSRLESLEKAIALKDQTELEDVSREDLARFIRFTASQLGDVWWRHPFSVLAVISLILAGVYGVVAVSPIGAADSPAWWFVRCGFLLAAGIAIFVATAIIQKRAGFLDTLTWARSAQPRVLRLPRWFR